MIISNSLAIRGMYGDDSGKSTEGTIRLQISGRSMNEILSIDFSGAYKVEIPVPALEQLAKQARTNANGALAGKTVEHTIKTSGYCSPGNGSSYKGQVTAWFRINNKFEMLTVSFEQLGQISLPYKPAADLISKYRRNLA